MTKELVHIPTSGLCRNVSLWEQLICFFNSSDPFRDVDWPLVFADLKVGNLFFIIGTFKLISLFISLHSRNSLRYDLPASSIVLTVCITSPLITSFVPNCINSFDSSDIKGLSNCSNSVNKSLTCLANQIWKLLESSW